MSLTNHLKPNLLNKFFLYFQWVPVSSDADNWWELSAVCVQMSSAGLIREPVCQQKRHLQPPCVPQQPQVLLSQPEMVLKLLYRVLICFVSSANAVESQKM